jgi:hypothetical protein
MTELELEQRDTPAVWVTAIAVGGVPVDLGRVFASLSVRHGRDDVDGPIQASTAALVLRRIDRSELDLYEVGLDLWIDSTFTAATGRPLFVGVITDATIVDDDPDEPRLELIATGPLAIAGRRSVGGQQWPAEAWAARAARILAEAGLAGDVVAPSRDVQIAATKPTDPETGYFETMSALDALDRSRQDVGATAYDEGGRIVVQAFDARRDLNLPGNVFTDPGFEAGVAGWVGEGNATVEHDLTVSQTGAGSLKVTPTVDDTYSRAMLPAPNEIPFVEGHRLSFSVWLRPSPGLVGKGCAVYFDKAWGSPREALDPRAGVIHTLAAGWQEVTLAETVVPAGALGMQINIGSDGAGFGWTTADSLWIDDVSIVDLDAEPTALPVDPAVVFYSPAWSKTLDVANRIVLGYGYGDGSVTVDDGVSQGLFGVRWTGLFESGLADQATAHDRALSWLERVAYPRWKLPSVSLLAPLDLSIGRMLELSALPASAPFSSWNPVVEGWTDNIDRDLWTQTVVLSDPVLSGLGLAWADVPPPITWATVDPACAWRDAYVLSNLEGSATYAR